MCPLIDHGQQPMKMHTEVTLLYKSHYNSRLIGCLYSIYSVQTFLSKAFLCSLHAMSVQKASDIFVSKFFATQASKRKVNKQFLSLH